jgi:hypothetical protein
MIDSTMTLPDGRLLACTGLGASDGPISFLVQRCAEQSPRSGRFDEDVGRRDVRVVPGPTRLRRFVAASRSPAADWPTDTPTCSPVASWKSYPITTTSAFSPSASRRGRPLRQTALTDTRASCTTDRPSLRQSRW